MLCAGRFRGSLCIFLKPGVLLNTLLYSVPGFRFQHFLLILFKNTPTCRLTELKSICGKVFKISSFTCNFFIAGEFYKNENTFLRGFIMGKSDIMSIGSPRPFPLPAASERGEVIRLTSFIHSEILVSHRTTFQHYHHVVCNAKSR